MTKHITAALALLAVASLALPASAQGKRSRGGSDEGQRGNSQMDRGHGPGASENHERKSRKGPHSKGPNGSQRSKAGQKNGHGTQQLAERLLGKFDADDSGSLNATELQAAVEGLRDRMQRGPQGKPSHAKNGRHAASDRGPKSRGQGAKGAKGQHGPHGDRTSADRGARSDRGESSRGPQHGRKGAHKHGKGGQKRGQRDHEKSQA